MLSCLMFIKFITVRYVHMSMYGCVLLQKLHIFVDYLLSSVKGNYIKQELLHKCVADVFMLCNRYIYICMNKCTIRLSLQHPPAHVQ